MKNIFLTIAILILLSFNGYAFDYVMGNTNYTYSTQAQPSKGESFVCSTFNTTIRRITNWHTDGVPHPSGAKGLSTGYPTWNPDNYDHTYVLLQIMDSGGGVSSYVVYKTAGWSFYKDLGSIFYAETYWEDVEPRWDTSGNHNTRIYYRRGMQLRYYDIESEEEGLIHDFKNEFPENEYIIYNGEEGSPSSDCRYWAFMHKKVSSPYNVDRLIIYDKQTDITTSKSISSTPNFVAMSPDGNYLLASYDWNGKGNEYDGPHTYNRDFSQNWHIGNNTLHWGWGYLADGTLVYVWQDYGDWFSYCECNKSGEVNWIPFFDYGTMSGYPTIHWSLMPSSKKGWAFAIIENDAPGAWSHAQIMAFKLEQNSNTVWRVAFNQDLATSYNHGFGQISRDGLYYYFGADWRKSDNMEVYRVVLPEHWYEDLMGLPHDSIAPASVNDLKANSITKNSVALVWTAPGDDVNVGSAAAYDIRYAKTLISETSWDDSTQCDNEPIPQMPGNQEGFTITGLVKNEVYYFALKTSDESNNVSGISNCVRANLDLTPPATVNDLAAFEGERFGQVELTWTAVGDDGTIGSASSYEIRYLTWQVTSDNWSGAVKCVAIPAPKPAKSNESFTVTKLDAGKRYYFAIKAIDDAGNKSPISNCADAVVQSVDPIAGNLSDVKAFPNPCRARDGGNAIFTNLTENCEIKIYNIAGEFVRKINEQTEGTAEWDLKNDEGEDVASGLYIYVITNQKDERKKGKLVVIR